MCINTIIYAKKTVEKNIFSTHWGFFLLEYFSFVLHGKVVLW